VGHFLSLADIVGFFGTATYLASYILLQKKASFAQTVAYSAMNLAAAMFVIISLLYSFNMSAFVSQCIWVVVSSYGMYKAYSRNKKTIDNDDPNKKAPLNNQGLFAF